MAKELPQIAKQIEDINEEIRQRLALLKEYGEDVAKAKSEYDKAVAINMVLLAGGEDVCIGSKTIRDLGASNRKKLAEGVAWKQMFDKELASKKYKSLVTQIDSLEAILNSKQSIYRHLDEN
jgi:hypothetical protein